MDHYQISSLSRSKCIVPQFAPTPSPYMCTYLYLHIHIHISRWSSFATSVSWQMCHFPLFLWVVMQLCPSVMFLHTDNRGDLWCVGDVFFTAAGSCWERVDLFCSLWQTLTPHSAAQTGRLTGQQKSNQVYVYCIRASLLKQTYQRITSDKV